MECIWATFSHTIWLSKSLQFNEMVLFDQLAATNKYCSTKWIDLFSLQHEIIDRNVWKSIQFNHKGNFITGALVF